MSFSSLEFVLNTLTIDEDKICLHFLLTFEIFNSNVNDCLVDSGASVNIIPLSVAKKINTKWGKHMQKSFCWTRFFSM